MSDGAVRKRAPESPAVGRGEEVWRPAYPLGRFFGMSPFSVMREMSNELERTFRGSGSENELRAWSPAMDVQVCNGSMVVSAALPGMKKEDVRVEVSDGELVIQGERKREHREDHQGYHRSEISYGQFHRAIPLPEGAKTDQVTAELKDGILKVSIPVPETAARSRSIPVS